MMKHILVVGPSGSGKTTLCRNLAENNPLFVHLWLDEEVKRLAGVEDHAEILSQSNGKQRLWNYFQQLLEDLHKPNPDMRIGLVDVGSAVLQSPQGRKYLIQHAANMIFIACSRDQLYWRIQDKLAKAGQRLPKGQIIRKLQPKDVFRVYKSAPFIIDTTLGGIAICTDQLKTIALKLATQSP